MAREVEMASLTPARQTLGMLAFAALAAGIVFLAVLPFDHAPGALPGPDILLVATFVWVIRRPELVPVWMVAAIFLLADFLLMRAPGLMAAAAVLASEYLRGRGGLASEGTFALEWGVAAWMIASVLFGTAAVLALLGAPTPGFWPLTAEVAGTVVFYPLMVVAARLFFGIRRPGVAARFGYGART